MTFAAGAHQAANPRCVCLVRHSVLRPTHQIILRRCFNHMICFHPSTYLCQHAMKLLRKLVLQLRFRRLPGPPWQCAGPRGSLLTLPWSRVQLFRQLSQASFFLPSKKYQIHWTSFIPSPLWLLWRFSPDFSNDTTLLEPSLSSAHASESSICCGASSTRSGKVYPGGFRLLAVPCRHLKQARTARDVVRASPGLLCAGAYLGLHSRACAEDLFLVYAISPSVVAQ